MLLQHLRGALYHGRVSANFYKTSSAPGGWKQQQQQMGTLPRAEAGQDTLMADPDGVSVMGYADLPQASVGSPLYVLAFAAPSSANATAVYAVWSTTGPTSIVFPAAEGCYHVVDMLGASRPGTVCTHGGQLRSGFPLFFCDFRWKEM